MEIIVEQKNRYGVVTLYPVNETARLFAMIAGTKTLTMDVLRLTKQLGYTITIKSDTVSI